MPGSNAHLLITRPRSSYLPAPFFLGDPAGCESPLEQAEEEHRTPLAISFVPDKFSDKDANIYGFDDRQFLYPGIKEGLRKLNEWLRRRSPTGAQARGRESRPRANRLTH